MPSTDKKTEFSKIKEVAVFKIFSKYSNFLKRVFIDLVREKLKKKSILNVLLHQSMISL